MSEINSVSGDFAKEEIIYSKLIDKIVYTHNSPFDQSLAAAIVDGRCVCNGYAQSMVYLCNLAGIDCIMTVSNEHAWNVIKLDGSWYYIDVTWMDQEAQGIWTIWCNVPSYASVRQQDQNNNHVFLSSLYSGIRLPDGNSDYAISFSGSDNTVSGGSGGGSSTVIKGVTSLTIKSTAVIPTLKITLPKTLSFVVNPYKMSLDSSGRLSSNESDVKNSYIVPVYGTGNSSWDITNNSGIGVSCLMYATAVNGNPTAISVEDANNGNKNISVNGEISDDKRIIRLALKGKAGISGSEKAIKLSSLAPDAWTETSGCTKFSPIPDRQALSITVDEEKSRCLTGSKCAETKWTTKDNVIITMAFKFDFVEL